MHDTVETNTTPDGTTIIAHYKNDLLHRSDGPALIVKTPSGAIFSLYFLNGVPHRADGAAMSLDTPDGSGFDCFFKAGRRVAPTP